MSYIEEFKKDPENLRLLRQEQLLVDVAILIYRTMKNHKLNKTQLATLLGVSKGRVSQYLGGERNLTLRTLADIFTAMGEDLEVTIATEIPIGNWRPLDVPKTASKQPPKLIFLQQACADSIENTGSQLAS